MENELGRASALGDDHVSNLDVDNSGDEVVIQRAVHGPSCFAQMAIRPVEHVRGETKAVSVLERIVCSLRIGGELDLGFLDGALEFHGFLGVFGAN